MKEGLVIQIVKHGIEVKELMAKEVERIKVRTDYSNYQTGELYFLTYFKHSVEGFFRRDPYMFGHFYDIRILLQCPENTVKRGPLHIRADHILSKRIKGLVRIFLSQAVHEPYHSAYHKLFFSGSLCIAQHPRGARYAIRHLKNIKPAFRMRH